MRIGDPPTDCVLCPRLASFISQWRVKEPSWHNGPVATWVPENGDDTVKVLIVGLAPGLRGANRTGKPFVGDASGDLLWKVLTKYGLSSDNAEGHMELHGLAITNAVRCVPPQNKPVASETNTCRDTWLRPTLRRFARLETVITLGRIAHDATIRALDARPADHVFGHNAVTELAADTGQRLAIRSSYHCSRYNINTGVLTEQMFEAVFAAVTEQS